MHALANPHPLELLELSAGPYDGLEPDIALARLTRDYSAEPPRPHELALVVEVAEMSLGRDLGSKRARYVAACVTEYWVVNLQNSRVHVYRGA